MCIPFSAGLAEQEYRPSACPAGHSPCIAAFVFHEQVPARLVEVHGRFASDQRLQSFILRPEPVPLFLQYPGYFSLGEVEVVCLFKETLYLGVRLTTDDREIGAVSL